MIRFNVRCSKSFLSLILALSLVFTLIGCSPRDDSQPVPESTQTDSVSGNESLPEASSDTRISDNGQPIYDFDEFVNGEWYDSIGEPDESVTYLSRSYLDYIDCVKEILDTVDRTSLKESDALYKVVTLYDELTDRSDLEGRFDSIQNYLSPINEAKSLNDLYVLFSKPEYALSDYLIYIDIAPDYYWDNIAYISPESNRNLLDYLNDSLDNESGDMTFRLYLNNLGYDDARIEELLGNAFSLCDKIDEFKNSDEWFTDYYFYNAEQSAEEGLKIPLFDIVDSLDGYGTHGYVLCKPCIYEFYNELFVPENLDVIKDYFLASSFWVLYFSGYDFLDITQAGEQLSGDEIAVIYLMNNAPDVISAEVAKKYCTDEVSKDINSTLLQIKTAAIKVVGGLDWLSDEAKELAKIKISRLTQYVGQNGHNYYFGNYSLSGNPVDDLIELRAQSFNFEMIQSYFTDTDRAPFGSSVNSCTAFYVRQYNCLLLSAGMISIPLFREAATFEEKLGYFGVVAAHEIGHSSDSAGILYNETGYYDPIITDDDYDAYMENMNSIIEFFDGLSVYEDYTITGADICDETYADIFAVRTALNMLAETDNPDYDLFFRTYAIVNGAVYGEDDIDAYAEDTHLMAKARINYVLGQFDEFYETYNIDESSPYYVPKDERLQFFD